MDKAREHHRRFLTGYRFTPHTDVVLDVCGLLVPREEATREITHEQPSGIGPEGVTWDTYREWVLS